MWRPLLAFFCITYQHDFQLKIKWMLNMHKWLVLFLNYQRNSLDFFLNFFLEKHHAGDKWWWGQTTGAVADSLLLWVSVQLPCVIVFAVKVILPALCMLSRKDLAGTSFHMSTLPNVGIRLILCSACRAHKLSYLWLAGKRYTGKKYFFYKIKN